MALYRADAEALLAPSQIEQLIVLPVAQAAICTQVATTIRTNSGSIRFPRVTADPSAAWVAEGQEIPVSDADVDEVTAEVRKLAALSIISRELGEDSTPEAAAVIGQGIARDLQRKLDTAFFGNTTANGPAGLGSLTNPTTITTGTTFASVDPFLDAISAAEGLGATIDAFVMSPADALALSKLREATGSNKLLFSPDPTTVGRRVIAGVPIYTSAAVTPKTIWGLPKASAKVVIRTDTELSTDKSVYFTSDRWAIRAILRVGFAFPWPEAVFKLKTSA